MLREELDKILENHRHWLDKDCKGWDTMRADLIDANLRGANLSGADLIDANLNGANLIDAENVSYIPLTCPGTGSFIGWKKLFDDLIACLEIPADAKRSSAASRKCRCDKAKVLSISSLDGSISDITEGCSMRDNSFVYRVGETVKVDNFDDNRWNECSTGIHFFINREEAVNYEYY